MESSRIYYGGIFLNKKELRDNKIKNEVELEYYSTRKFNSLNEEDMIYGIEIVKKEYKRRKVNIETNNIENISNNSNTIKEIIDILRRNTVTPSGLQVTMDELLKQGRTE